MTMKVQTKIALLIVLVVAIFMAGLWGFRAYDKAKFRRITAERFDERRNAFDLFWEKDGEPLKTLAEYDTTWDDMVKAIQQKNIKWLQENVSDETLLGYKANAVWIYDSAATLIYSRNSSNARPLDLPIPREAFAQLFSGDSFANFFVRIGDDLVEIRAATVHGSKDSNRQTPQQGFFFVGRLWNTEELKERSVFSNTTLSLAPAGEPARKIQSEPEKGLIVFS